MLRRLSIFLLLAYLLACAAIYADQDELVFLPRPLHAENAAGLKDLQLRVPRPGALLHGWQINPGKQRLLLYYGGNAEEVSHLAREFAQLGDYSTLLLNYRGYGLSSGAPGEQALFGDALWVYDQLHHILGYRPRQVILVGRSLGSGVAMHVASQRNVDGVALVTPFDSLRAVAAVHYPWLPVSLLLRHPFDSLDAAPGVTAPVQFLLAESDSVVPPDHSERLAAALPARPRVDTLRGTAHDTVMTGPAFWSALRGFLDSLQAS